MLVSLLLLCQDSVALERGSSLDQSLGPSASRRYTLGLRKGESAEVTVTQRGADVVLELLAPDGRRVDSVDSPTGSTGDEELAIVAEVDGAYAVLVRLFDGDARGGDYRIAVRESRDQAETERWSEARTAARRSASGWLRERAGALALHEGALEGPGLERFDLLAEQTRVLGLGEATHGSQEFGDVRLALTRRLVAQHEVRLIALEASSARLRTVDAWARNSASSEGELPELFGPGWIGRRPMQALARFAREWNTAHPGDPLELVGLDAQDNGPAREILSDFGRKAFEPDYAARMASVVQKIAAADAQAAVFGPSDVGADEGRFLRQLLGRLELERSILEARLGEPRVRAAVEAVRDLAQFAEFNGGRDGEPQRSRDWTMAANLLRVLQPGERAVYWGHNAHVAHIPSSPDDTARAGAILRKLLGEEYGAVATSFREGGFLAQLPDDPGDRLMTFTLPPSPEESIDAVLDAMSFGDGIVTWTRAEAAVAPKWLATPRPMHWIGGLFSGAWLPHQWIQPQRLVADFDGVVFLQKVQSEIVPEIGKRRAP